MGIFGRHPGSGKHKRPKGGKHIEELNWNI